MNAPRRLQGSSSHVHQSPEEYYRAAYFNILDNAINALRNRVVCKAVPVLLCIERFLLSARLGDHIDDTDVLLLTRHYGNDLNAEDLRCEARILKNLPSSSDSTNRNSSTKEIITEIGNSGIKNLIPNIFRLSILYLICPASTAVPERSFSLLRRIKSHLRNALTQQHLNNFMLLSMYKHDVDNINMKETVNSLYYLVMRKDVMLLAF